MRTKFNSYGLPQLEYMNCGYIDTVSRPTRAALSEKTASARYIGGYATRYKKAHFHKGRFEIMMPGCFATTLIKEQVVRFLVNHDEGQLVATTYDGLKLYSDDIGLAFTLSVPNTETGHIAYAAVKFGDLPCMSIGYETMEVERKV